MRKYLEHWQRETKHTQTPDASVFER